MIFVPDRQVQQVVHLVFDQFDRLSSARAVLTYFNQQLLLDDLIRMGLITRTNQFKEHGAESIAAAFFIHNTADQTYLDYLLRRYKGHFYRNRYPQITLV